MNDKPSLEDALAHYGVKGMKWGVSREGRTGKQKAGLVAATVVAGPFGYVGFRAGENLADQRREKMGLKPKAIEAPKAKKIGLVENTKLNVKAQREFDEKKLNTLVNRAAKDKGDVLIKSFINGDNIGLVQTGNEFVDTVSKGAYMNVGATHVWAYKSKDPRDKGAYIPSSAADRNQQYKWKNYNKP